MGNTPRGAFKNALWTTEIAVEDVDHFTVRVFFGMQRITVFDSGRK